MINSVRLLFTILICLTLFAACSSPSNKRAISIDQLDTIQAEDRRITITRDILTAGELIDLSDCRDLICVQQYMKNLSNDFVHATKGEFASLHRSAIADTAGNPLIMPVSTLYVDVNPQANWRLAHTLHRAEDHNKLMEEFRKLRYKAIDSGYYNGLNYQQTQYASDRFPGINLFTGTTYRPWYFKGLYKQVTWPCYVFEVRMVE